MPMTLPYPPRGLHDIAKPWNRSHSKRFPCHQTACIGRGEGSWGLACRSGCCWFVRDSLVLLVERGTPCPTPNYIHAAPASVHSSAPETPSHIEFGVQTDEGFGSLEPTIFSCTPASYRCWPMSLCFYSLAVLCKCPACTIAYKICKVILSGREGAQNKLSITAHGGCGVQSSCGCCFVEVLALAH